MSEELNGEMADWERAWERESGWGRFGHAMQDLKAAMTDHLWRNLIDPIPPLVLLVMILIALIFVLLSGFHTLRQEFPGMLGH